jgi:hypothetical protein
LPGLAFLREPGATVGTLQSIRNALRVGQQLTEVLPDKSVKLLGRTITSVTALGMRGVDRLDSTAAHIVARAVFGRPGDAGGLTHAATDQGPQPIVMRGVVARGSLLIKRQFGVDEIAYLLAHERWNGRDVRPGLGWGGGLAIGWFAKRMRGGAPKTGRAGMGPADIELAGLGRVRQQPVEGGGTPTSMPAWRLDPALE